MFPKRIRQVVRQLTGGGVSAIGSSRSCADLGKAIFALLAMVCATSLNAVPPGTADEIRTRLVPAGQLCRAGDDCGVAVAAGPTAVRSGEEVYNQFCFACHATGVGGAPKVGDTAEWEPRIAKGMDALWTTMQNGLNAMPAKGTCVNCSDDELRDSMNYLVDSAN